MRNPGSIMIPQENSDEPGSPVKLIHALSVNVTHKISIISARLRRAARDKIIQPSRIIKRGFALIFSKRRTAFVCFPEIAGNRSPLSIYLVRFSSGGNCFAGGSSTMLR